LLDAIFATATVAAGVDFPARTVVITVADRRGNRGWEPLTASELQQMTGRAGRRGKDRVGFIIAAPGPHQNPRRIAELLSAAPNDLDSQFRATYTSLLNLLDAFGSFAQVRAITERSFAFRNLLPRIHQLEKAGREHKERIQDRLQQAGIDLPAAAVLGLERLAGARTRLIEGAPQTRREMRQRWLDKTARPGRVVSIGRSGRRLALITARSHDGVTAVREDGRFASFPLQRIGRVFAPTFSTRTDRIEAAFDEIHDRGHELALSEPRLRDAQSGEDDAIKLISDLIDSLSATVSGSSQSEVAETVWSLVAEARAVEQAEREIERWRSEIWEPFDRCARVLDHFGYLDFVAELVTQRGKWLADLRVDRPLLIGEALQRDLFASLDTRQTAALIAALVADEDRDYGEVELDDAIVSLLVKFEEISFEVSTEEWKQGIEATAEINFSAAAAAALWADGATWSELVHETRAEEGDLVRLLSRTGEALLQIAGLRQTHSAAANLAYETAEIVLREPVR
jgi:ATP-dependent RNA helicase HelY